MELMEASPTDKRLDDLNSKVDQGFERIDADLRGLRAEMRTEFTALRGEMKSESAALRSEIKDESATLRSEMKAGFDSMNQRFDAVNERFEATHRLMVQFCGGLLGAVIVAFAGLIATQL